MRFLFITSLLTLASSCLSDTPSYPHLDTKKLSSHEPISQNDTLESGLLFDVQETYNACINKVRTHRASLAVQFERATDSQEKERLLTQAGRYFEGALLDTLMPHWYGTPWDFNGHTNEPNKGEIACGYLVSTTLKHMGINLNRYKMAQQSAMSETKTLCLGEKEVVIHYSAEASPKPSGVSAGLAEGLYLVGLSNHVGFFLIRNGGYYFIHSDYVSGKVRFEKAETSAAFQSSIYCYAPISTNKALMTRWLKKEEVPIVLD